MFLFLFLALLTLTVKSNHRKRTVSSSSTSSSSSSNNKRKVTDCTELTGECLASADIVYYIACVEEEWDYAPFDTNVLDPSDTSSDTWLKSSSDRIGDTYLKSMFRQYTDSSFSTRKKRAEKWKHLGVLGPVIRGTVGDRIKVVFKNMCSFPASMHPHGLKYEKHSEGAPYDDGSTDGDSIEPNGMHTYIWDVRPTAIDKETDSKLWLYHSHVDEINDIHTGLVGPIIVDRHKNVEKKLDGEFVAYFMLLDENASNLFGNSKDFQMKLNDNVRWYVASLGNEGDGPHSPHWHGNILSLSGKSVDSVITIPGITETLDMICDANGIWLFHCHVNDHIEAGMSTFYYVNKE